MVVQVGVVGQDADHSSLRALGTQTFACWHTQLQLRLAVRYQAETCRLAAGHSCQLPSIVLSLQQFVKCAPADQQDCSILH